MDALNIEAEYRKVTDRPEGYSISEFVDSKVRSGAWVEDDGAYYTFEEWESQYGPSEGEQTLDAMIAESDTTDYTCPFCSAEFPTADEYDVHLIEHDDEDPITCSREGTHLRSTDDDGYCNACGHQEDPTGSEDATDDDLPEYARWTADRTDSRYYFDSTTIAQAAAMAENPHEAGTYAPYGDNTYRVIDEDSGVIAYLNSEDSARLLTEALNAQDKS